MHHQIQTVISSIIMHGADKTHVRLSAGEQSPLGRLIGRMYYRTKLTDLLNHDEMSGYPHNGGEHTLNLHCKTGDAIAFIEAFKEEALDRLCNTEEEQNVANQLSYVSQEILHAAAAQRRIAKSAEQATTDQRSAG